MRKTEAKIKDFRHNMTREYLKSMLKVSALQKLNWLEEAYNFTRQAHSLRYLQKWREYKEGKAEGCSRVTILHRLAQMKRYKISTDTDEKNLCSSVKKSFSSPTEKVEVKSKERVKILRR